MGKIRKTGWGFSLLHFDFLLKKKTHKKKKPMIIHFLYCPAQVSWSDGSVLLFHFLPGPGEPE